MTLTQLHSKYRSASPIETLESLVELLKAPPKPDFRPPMLTIALSSGYTFRGYVLNSSAGAQEKEKTYVFSLEILNDADKASDLCYVLASKIDAVTVWNVEDYPGTLPRFPKKP